MKIFGLTLFERKELRPATAWTPLTSFIGEWNTGTWQRNLANPASRQSALAFSAVYSCITLIASDIAKLRLMLTEQQPDGTWQEPKQSPYLAVIKKQNDYQTRVQFIMNWITSKLIWGNAYVLKERDNRGGESNGIVRKMHVLDPCRVTPLVSDAGEVFYRLMQDYLAEVSDDDVIVPASEIIHDRMPTLWHPLVGVSPIYACALSALQGIGIQNNSDKFFANMSRPSGILTSAKRLSKEQVAELKEKWESGFSGNNAGRTAVLDADLSYQTVTIPAQQAQLIEQLRWTVEDVARCFHVPSYKINLQANMTLGNSAQYDQDYYAQCLQVLIEAFEVCMDEGLELRSGLRTEFDLTDLLRMDPLGMAEANAKRIGAGELAPNEARLRQNLPPVDGGDEPYLQQQNYSLAALARRDAMADPFGRAAAPAPAPPPDNSTRELLDRIEQKFAALESDDDGRDTAELATKIIARLMAETADD